MLERGFSLAMASCLAATLSGQRATRSRGGSWRTAATRRHPCRSRFTTRSRRSGSTKGGAPRPRARCDPLTEQRFERRACRACGPRTWRKVGERSRQRDASSLIPATFEAEAKGADAAAYQLTVFLGPAFVRPAPGGVGSIFGWTPFVPTLLAIARKAARSNPANRGAARSHAQARVAPGEHGERG